MKKFLFLLLLLPAFAMGQTGSLELPYPIKLVVPKPLDFFYYESDGTPYDNTSEVITQVTSALRYQGQTFNVNGIEYWFKDGIADGDLVVKLADGGASAFTDLSDVPSSYSGQGGKILAVTDEEDGIEFIDAPSGGGESYTFGDGLTEVAGTVSIAEGDKGDITVNNDTWTIDNGAVSLAKLANIESPRLLGRYSTGTGTPQAITVGNGLTLGTNGQLNIGGTVTANIQFSPSTTDRNFFIGGANRFQQIYLNTSLGTIITAANTDQSLYVLTTRPPGTTGVTTPVVKLDAAYSSNVVNNGPAILFSGQKASGLNRDLGDINFHWTDATDPKSAFSIKGRTTDVVNQLTDFLNIDGNLSSRARFYGPLRLMNYATGSIPAASSHPYSLVYDQTTNEIKISDGSLWSAIGGGGGASAFTDLSDVPSSYTGAGGKFLAVKSGADGIEFVDAPSGGSGAEDFIDLGDVPSSYTGQEGKFLAVNGSGDGIEFVDAPSGSISDGDKGDITVTGSGSTWTVDNNAITTVKINDSAITSGKIASSAVTTAKINNGAVTTLKIDTLAVTTGKLAESAVTTSKINDSAITSGKIANSAVTTAKINNGAVTYEKIQSVSANSVLGRGSSSGEVNELSAGIDHVLRRNGSGALSFGTLQTGNLGNNIVTYAKIQQASANTFLANVTGSTANVQEISTTRIPLFSSAITGTPSSSTYLRGDGTWATISGSGDVLDRTTSSTAGSTITLDMNSQSQRIFVGSASFSSAKTIALSNTTNALVFNFHFEVTNVAAVLTCPNTFLMADDNWNGTSDQWTPPATGKYEMGGVFDGTNWKVKVVGPYN